MNDNPFSSSDALACWAADKLRTRGLDEVANWRMLEYWFQVEVFRLIQAGQADGWRHLGNYEQPYHTELPRSGSKTKTKWIDLVAARPILEDPDTVVWIELKDVGRSKATITTNARGLGHDLAALWALDPNKTQELWLQPQSHSMDRGRLDEWNKFGPSLSRARHLIAQIVISPTSMDGATSPDEIISAWKESFVHRVADSKPYQVPEIKRDATDKFHVFALVADLKR